MPTLVNITQSTPNAVQIWGFHGRCDVTHVTDALKTIAATLSGTGHTLHVMSGTHGYCKGEVGAVATREQRFAEEDRALVAPRTRDGKAVQVQVHDFNTTHLSEADVITAAMAKLNTDMRRLASGPGSHTFLLAYCCSAGTT